jgi:hypothetical protein
MGAPSAAERWRRGALWACLLVFLVRVFGQIEVLLLKPAWLPPFAAWESGLVPYPLLLPLQVLLIGWMAVVAVEHARGAGLFWVSRRSTRRRLTIFAAGYAAVMGVRLVLTMALPPHRILERGLIPILAHWDLALFILLVSRARSQERCEPLSELRARCLHAGTTPHARLRS